MNLSYLCQLQRSFTCMTNRNALKEFFRIGLCLNLFIIALRNIENLRVGKSQLIYLIQAVFVSLSCVLMSCGSRNDDRIIYNSEKNENVLEQVTMYKALTTLYTTENNRMEGGPKDRRGVPLNSLENALQNSKPVSVAFDVNAFPYGTILRIPELEDRFGKSLRFKVVDTGGAFKNKGKTRMDICVGNSQKDIYSQTYSWMSHKTFSYYVEN